MRKKNENDPLVYPARFRKPGLVPQQAQLSSLRKRIIRLDTNRRCEIARLEKQIVSNALLTSSQSQTRPTMLSSQVPLSDDLINDEEGPHQD